MTYAVFELDALVTAAIQASSELAGLRMGINRAKAEFEERANRIRNLKLDNRKLQAQLKEAYFGVEQAATSKTRIEALEQDNLNLTARNQALEEQVKHLKTDLRQMQGLARTYYNAREQLKSLDASLNYPSVPPEPVSFKIPKYVRCTKLEALQNQAESQTRMELGTWEMVSQHHFFQAAFRTSAELSPEVEVCRACADLALAKGILVRIRTTTSDIIHGLYGIVATKADRDTYIIYRANVPEDFPLF